MAKKEKRVINEATTADEKLLKSVTRNEADAVYVRGRKFKIRWMHPNTCDWITCLMLKEGNDNKVIAQSAALIRLNGFWKSHLFYCFVWRWYYYIRQYNARELTPIIEMAQKKTAQEGKEAYFTATILLTALMDSKKQMTKEEAERTLRALRGDSDGKSPKSTASAPPHSAS